MIGSQLVNFLNPVFKLFFFGIISFFQLFKKLGKFWLLFFEFINFIIKVESKGFTDQIIGLIS